MHTEESLTAKPTASNEEQRSKTKDFEDTSPPHPKPSYAMIPTTSPTPTIWSRLSHCTFTSSMTRLDHLAGGLLPRNHKSRGPPLVLKTEDNDASQIGPHPLQSRAHERNTIPEPWDFISPSVPRQGGPSS